MLNVLRQNFKEQPWLKLVLLIVSVGLVAFLGSYFTAPGGSANGWVARVNGVEIPAQQLSDTARRMDDYYRQLFGDEYDQYRESLQIRQQALQALIEQEIILQDAKRMGLKVAPTDIARQIRTNPNLQDENGRFVGDELYQQFIGRTVPGGVRAYERALTEDLLVGQWTDLVTAPVRISEDELREMFRKQSEKTTVDYVMVASADQDIDTKVTDEQLDEYYQANQERYRQQEGRTIRFVVVDREAQRAKVEVTDEQILQAYQANEASYARPEQRGARHILFRTSPEANEQERQAKREAAEAALERARAGEDFAALARELSEDPVSAERGGDLGLFGRGRMVPAFEEAAWNTPVGEFAPVTESDFGFHVIQVTRAQEAGVVPLEEVREQLRRQLELEAAQRLATEEAERLRGDITTAARLEEVAEREGLDVQSRTVRRDQRLGDLGASPDFMKQVFTLEPGQVSAPVRVAAGQALVAVDEEVEAAVAPLDEVRTQVRVDLLNDRTREIARSRARQALAGGQSVQQAAGALDLEVQTSKPLAPGEPIPGSGGATPEMRVALFGENVEVGQTGLIEVPGGALIYEIKDHQGFDETRFQEVRHELRGQVLAERQNRYRQEVVELLRIQQEVDLNHRLLNQQRG